MKKQLSVLVCLTLGAVAFLVLPHDLLQKIQSANLTSVSDTLSSSHLSFYGLMGAGNTVGATQIVLNTTTAPSTSSSQLASPSASTVKIGVTVYSLDNIMPNGDESKFSITSALVSGDQTAGNAVIATQSASHTMKFVTASAVPNGAIRILVKATTNTGSSADGIPDGDGFDFGATAPSVKCPSDVAATYDFVAGTATAQAVTIGSSKYHSFECRYSGTGVTGQSFVADPIIITSLINPAPKSGHAVGTSDPYSVIIQNLGATTYPLIDQTTIQVGVIESVRVSATVDPQITFKIAGIPTSTSICGITTDVTTTATTVPFGSVAISSFTDAAQSLEISTNAVGGYAVTAQQNDNLGKDARACADGSFPTDCIQDTTGDAGTITYGTKGDWTSATTASAKGFGYTLHKITTAGTAAFNYNDASGGCAGTYCAKQFADLANSEPAQTIFSSTTVADVNNIDVCYKIVISSTQPAGDYENHVIYTATATF